METMKPDTKEWIEEYGWRLFATGTDRLIASYKWKDKFKLFHVKDAANNKEYFKIFSSKANKDVFIGILRDESDLTIVMELVGVTSTNPE